MIGGGYVLLWACSDLDGLMGLGFVVSDSFLSGSLDFCCMAVEYLGWI